MSFQFLSVEPDADGILLITINRPAKLNALNQAVIVELGEAFRKAREEAAVKGVILTGAGEKAFIAGADIGEIARLDPVEAELVSRRGQQVFRSLETLRKPSVAAINGYALGGGLELAMCCTVRLASENAKLGQPEVKLGIVPGYGATQRLPRLVGRGRALELLLSGEPIGASEAYRIGLVNGLASQPALIDTARQWLLKVVANSPLAVGLTAASDDRREGTTAFLEKRKAIFTGR